MRKTKNTYPIEIKPLYIASESLLLQEKLTPFLKYVGQHTLFITGVSKWRITMNCYSSIMQTFLYGELQAVPAYEQYVIEKSEDFLFVIIR